jgi:hypothetical protein
MPDRRPPIVLLLAVLVLAPASAHAGPADPSSPSSGSPYAVSWAVDLPVSAAAAAALVVPHFLMDDLVRGGGPHDAASVNGLDRFVTDLHSSGANTASDVLLWSLVALPFAANGLDAGLSGDSWGGWATDGVVMAEAVLVSAGLNQLTKIAVQRPRPLLYDRPAGDPSLDVPDNHLSFYSGHTSTTFAAGMAWAFTFAHRHPDSPWRYAAYGGAALAGSTVGLLRVLAGKHFVSDVLVGAVAGTLCGLGVPWLHTRTGASVAATPGPRGGAVMSITVPLP